MKTISRAVVIAIAWLRGKQRLPANGEGHADHRRLHLSVGNGRAPALRWLLTALVMAIAAPMLAGCVVLRSDEMRLTMPESLCRGMLQDQAYDRYCDAADKAKNGIVYNTSTRHFYFPCDDERALTVLGTRSRVCGPSSQLLKATPEALAWLATQGIMTPDVSTNPVLTNTPVTPPPPPDG